MNSSMANAKQSMVFLEGEHIIVRLTYISCYNNHNPSGELETILKQARTNNESNGITGALVFNHNFFLQSIEGSRPAINELIRKLIKDERHFSVQIIECREIEQRRWTQWSMKYLTPDESNQRQALRFSGGTSFNPYLMSTRQIMMLIDNLSKEQERLEKLQKSVKKKKFFGRK